MLVISSREFRDHQKKYFELVDNNEQIIVQRAKNKAYAVVPITETDRYFSNPAVQKHLKESMAQADRGEFPVILKTAEDIDKFLGL
jgi:antitoxin YefM